MVRAESQRTAQTILRHLPLVEIRIELSLPYERLGIAWVKRQGGLHLTYRGLLIPGRLHDKAARVMCICRVLVRRESGIGGGTRQHERCRIVLHSPEATVGEGEPRLCQRVVSIQICRFLVLFYGRLKTGVILLQSQRFSSLERSVRLRVVGSNRGTFVVRLVTGDVQ